MKIKTVLIIDDNSSNVKLFRDIIESRDWKAIDAENAETGIDLARENLPDLILMDIQLPGINGLEATKLLKNDAATAHIPVIALTSQAMAGDREKAIEAGCDEYITKPIQFREFVKNLEMFLQRPGS